MNIVFVSWLPHCRRSDALAAALGGHSYLVHYLRVRRPFYAPLKYVLQTLATLRLLLRERPGLVLVASPPVIAIIPPWLYAKIFNIPFIIDAHTGIFDDARWRWLLPLSRFLSRQATLTIVTNDYLCEEIKRWGARAMIIGDVPVVFRAYSDLSLGDGFHVVVVNTFSGDEPLQEILDAARKTPGVFLHITGDLRRANSAVMQRTPENVRFTGWLDDEPYTKLLRAADAVMVLTRRDHAMQRGAYEAMALGKPLITSDWPILRETFYLGSVHVRNFSTDIRNALIYTERERTRLCAEMVRLRQERAEIFAMKLEEFWKILYPLMGKHRSVRTKEVLK